MCSCPFWHALFWSDNSTLFYQCLSWFFPHLTFLLGLFIPILWHSSPVPPWKSLAELSFILQCSKQLHQTLPFSSITARYSSSIKFLFCPPPPPINVLHSRCLTSKAPLLTQVPPQLFTDTQQKNPKKWPKFGMAAASCCQVRGRPGKGAENSQCLPGSSSARSASFKKILCVQNELHRKEANSNCFCLGLQNRIHE